MYKERKRSPHTTQSALLMQTDILIFLTFSRIPTVYSTKHLLQPIAIITYTVVDVSCRCRRPVCLSGLVWSGLSACATQVTLLRNFGRCELFYTLCTYKGNERVAFMAHGISSCGRMKSNKHTNKQQRCNVEIVFYTRIYMDDRKESTVNFLFCGHTFCVC